MIKKLLLVFLFTPFHAAAQFDYELFESYLGKTAILQNSRLISSTEFREDKEKWIRTSVQKFNLNGLPGFIAEYDDQGTEQKKRDFLYDSSGTIQTIETYENGKHVHSTEFEVASARIVSFTDYVYGPMNGEKMFVWKTNIEYHVNGTISKSIKLQGNAKDTIEINFFDTSGTKTKSYWHMGGLRTTKIEYKWNKDKTMMKELHYENDLSVYNKIIHKYKAGREIEKTDHSTSLQPFYWKYDDNGRVTETNEQFYYVQYFEYDPGGYLIKKTVNLLFSDADEKDLPKKVRIKYEYQFRN